MARGSAQSPADLDSIWRAPLVPAALAYTAGIVLDHYAAVPFVVSLLLMLGAMLGWFVASWQGRARLPLVFLALAGMAFGAAYHHYRRDVYPDDDVGGVATAEAKPVQIRGYLDEEPLHTLAHPDPLRSIAAGESSTTILRAVALRQSDDWLTVSGRVHLMVSGHGHRSPCRRRGGSGGPAVADPRPRQSRRRRTPPRPGAIEECALNWSQRKRPTA